MTTLLLALLLVVGDIFSQHAMGQRCAPGAEPIPGPGLTGTWTPDLDTWPVDFPVPSEMLTLTAQPLGWATRNEAPAAPEWGHGKLCPHEQTDKTWSLWKAECWYEIISLKIGEEEYIDPIKTPARWGPGHQPNTFNRTGGRPSTDPASGLQPQYLGYLSLSDHPVNGETSARHAFGRYFSKSFPPPDQSAGLEYWTCDGDGVSQRQDKIRLPGWLPDVHWRRVVSSGGSWAGVTAGDFLN